MSPQASSPAKRPPFEAVYREFWPRILGYVRRNVEDGADAEDVTAEIFLRAYQAYSRFEARCGSPAPWLFTIARHACLDQRHRKGLDNRLSRRLRESIEPVDPITVAERRLEWRRLEECIAQLPARQQEALKFFHWRGMSLKEAAARMCCTEDAAKMLCHRGLKALRTRVRTAA